MSRRHWIVIWQVRALMIAYRAIARLNDVELAPG